MADLRLHDVSTRDFRSVFGRNESPLNRRELELEGDARIVIGEDSRPILEWTLFVEELGMPTRAQIYERDCLEFLASITAGTSERTMLKAAIGIGNNFAAINNAAQTFNPSYMMDMSL